MKRIFVLLSLLLSVLAIRFVPGAGEYYSLYLYPAVSAILSGIACIAPFALEEWVVIFGVFFLLSYPVIAAVRHIRPFIVIRREMEVVLLFIVWFYLGWGCNYFRSDFYARCHVEPVKTCDESFFLEYLNDFADSINSCYPGPFVMNREEAETCIKAGYNQLPDSYGLCSPKDYQHPKKVIFNQLYSAVGVLGYMGPFFCESQLNLQLLPDQYPFTYAHELAHLLGISGEAEANYWAYKVCTEVSNRSIRYCGYYGLLPYLIQNAHALLSSEDYRMWLQRLDSRILSDLDAKSKFWKAQQIDWINDIQEHFYDWYLKSNNIPSGKANYSQVVQMILSVRRKELTSK